MNQIHEYPINAMLEVLRSEYRRQGSEVEFWPFFYNAEYLPVALSSSAVFVNTADNDSDFAIFQTMQSAFNSVSGAFVATPNCTVRIVYDVSGRRLEDRDTHLLNIFGRGQRPFWWPRPFVVRAKGSWSTTINNLDAAVAFNIRLTFSGVKVFRLPPRG